MIESLKAAPMVDMVIKVPEEIAKEISDLARVHAKGDAARMGGFVLAMRFLPEDVVRILFGIAQESVAPIEG